LDELTAYQDEALQEDETEEGAMKYIESYEALGNLLRYKIETLGEQYVLTEVYHYLLDENDTRDEVTFLYYLQ
jgi:hypothetical protein